MRWKEKSGRGFSKLKGGQGTAPFKTPEGDSEKGDGDPEKGRRTCGKKGDPTLKSNPHEMNESSRIKPEIPLLHGHYE